MPSRLSRIPLGGGIGHAAGDRQRLLRARAPRDHRRDVAGIQAHLGIELRALVRFQRAPIVDRRFPRGALGRARPAADVVERGLVGGDEARAGAAFDRHVADRHPPFHRKRADRVAGIFDDIAGAAGRADLVDDGEDDVFRADADRQRAVDVHAHVLRARRHAASAWPARARPRTCRCRTRARRMRHASRCAMSPHTIVSPGSVQPCSGPMMCTMPWRISSMPKYSMPNSRALFSSVCDRQRGLGIADAELAVGRRHVVVGDGKRQLGAARPAPGVAQALERLGARHFVDKVPVDIEHARLARLLVDEMALPDFIVQRAWCACGGHGFRSTFPGPVSTSEQPEAQGLSSFHGLSAR